MVPATPSTILEGGWALLPQQGKPRKETLLLLTHVTVAPQDQVPQPQQGPIAVSHREEQRGETGDLAAGVPHPPPFIPAIVDLVEETGTQRPPSIAVENRAQDWPEQLPT